MNTLLKVSGRIWSSALQKHPMCSALLMSCSLVLAASAQLFAQEREPGDPMLRSLLVKDSADIAAIENDMDVISFGLEIVPTPGAGSFFDGYALLFGKTTALDAFVSPVLTGRIRLGEKFRLVFGSSYMGTGFTELYDAAHLSSDFPGKDTLVAAAQIYESFTVQALPVLIGFQYTPIRSQFTSYVGGAIGGAFATTTWESDTRPFENVAYSRPETNVEESGLVPALRAFAGLDLRFDRFFRSENLFRGLYIEAAYIYLPVTRNYFKEIRTISRGLPVVPQADEATINLGGFTVSIGLNMQLLRP